MTQRADAKSAVAACVKALGKLDIEEADFDRVIAVSLQGVFLTGQVVYPDGGRLALTDTAAAGKP